MEIHTHSGPALSPAVAAATRLAGMKRKRFTEPNTEVASSLRKVRQGNIESAVQRFLQQGTDSPLHQLGAIAYGFYTVERTQRVIESTRFRKALPAGCEPGGPRFRALQRALGGALVEQANLIRPSFDKRIQHLLEVADAAAALYRLLSAVHDGWNAWSEVRMTMGDVAREAGRPSAWDESSVDPGHFPWAVAQIEAFAKMSADMLEKRKLHTAPDAKRYVADLAVAYRNFSAIPAGRSTDQESGKKRGGPFPRFAQAAALEIGIDLPLEQAGNLLSLSKRLPTPKTGAKKSSR